MAIILFVSGLLVGSFLNVVVLRYNPKKFLLSRDVFFGRSRCMACGKTLRWFELVPVVSFIFQRGKCRSCGARLTPQYIFMELLSGLIFLGVYWSLPHLVNRFNPLTPYDPLLLGLLWILVFTTLLVISAIDLRLRIIPDEASAFLALLGLAAIFLGMRRFGLVEGSFVGHYALLLGFRMNIWVNHLVGALLATAFFGFIIGATRGRAMGLGDLKLAAALGWVFGWPDILVITVLAFVMGALVGVGSIVSLRKSLKSFLAFGPFLALGSFIVFFWGFSLVNAYFGLFSLAP